MVVEFEKLNPLHYVPVLVDDNVVVSDSYAIFLVENTDHKDGVEWENNQAHLEEKYTPKPLLPVDPQLRALNLQVASIVHSSIQPLHMLNVLKDMEKMFGAESGGIFRFKHHLAGTRKDFEPCAMVPEEVKILMMKIVAEAKETSMRKKRLLDTDEEDDIEKEMDMRALTKGKGVGGARVQITLNQMMKKDYKDQVDQQVARYFYTSVIPFNSIKNVEFIKMCEMIGRYGIGYKPPSYHDVREKLLKQAMIETDSMLEEFKKEWKRTGCSIMSDGWTDKKRQSICNFLINSPKGTVFLYSLDTSDIKFFKMLDDVVNCVGEETVVQVVTENATNYKVAGEMLMQTRKNLYWTPCAAHCIDLIFEDFEKKLKVHEVTIKKGRKITTYIYSRTMLISMLKKFTKGRDLVRPVVVPLMTVLRLVDSDEKPVMGFIYDGMDCAKKKIKINFDNVKKSYEPVWNIIDERWDKQLHRPLHAAAYYLNLHFYYDPNFRDDDVEVKQGLYNCMTRLVSDLNERSKIGMQLADFHYARRLFGLDTTVASRKVMLPVEW
uniref:Glutathione S-transferase 1 n=1 Tax=Cajanus cajan TaxID=3821 RepID=A0A151SCI6_CAJCA|nr:Glutathione S-transferase 1 [Cajanus cajan]